MGFNPSQITTFSVFDVSFAGMRNFYPCVQESGCERGLQDRRASAKDAEIKGCGWIAHILFSM